MVTSDELSIHMNDEKITKTRAAGRLAQNLRGQCKKIETSWPILKITTNKESAKCG